MLAQPLSDADKGGRCMTSVPLSPGSLLPDDDVSGTLTGVSSASPPFPHPTSSFSSPSFFPAASFFLPHSTPSLNLLHSPSLPSSTLLPPPTSASSSPSVAPCLSSPTFPPSVILSPFLCDPSSFSPSAASLPQSSTSTYLLPHSLHPSPRPSPAALSSHLSFITPPPPFYSSPPISLSLSTSPSFSSTTSLAPSSDSTFPTHSTCSTSSISSPVFFTSSLSLPHSPISLCPQHPPASLSVSPSIIPPPNPPPCCSCSSLLTRLLTSHRLEMRRLLRGAMASLTRRLDLLESRSRRKRWRKRTCTKRGRGPVFRSFCSPDPIPAFTPNPSSSSASLERDTSTAPLSWCRGQMEEGRERKRKRSNIDKAEEDEAAGRFVGQMRVSVRGGASEKDIVLTLHNFNHRRKQERVWPSLKTTAVIRQNGYSISDSSSQNALHLLQSADVGQASSQSEELFVSVSQRNFSDIILLTSLAPSRTFSPLQHCSFSPILLMSEVSVGMLLELWSRAFGSPVRPLKDWTPPPSLSSDHCYAQRPTISLTCCLQRQRRHQANAVTQGLYLPQRQPGPLPSHLTNGLSASFSAGQSKSASKLNLDCSKRVSQIRIRRASPRETPLTPMGLPKVKRLKKKEFSLEEIYTNKNYKSPSTNRSLETIFEEPREKDGAMLLIGQQRRRRLLLFPDFTQPRKRKRPQGVGLPVAMGPRKRVARRHCQSGCSGDEDIDLDVMLVERLSALEDFMNQEGLDV